MENYTILDKYSKYISKRVTKLNVLLYIDNNESLFIPE